MRQNNFALAASCIVGSTGLLLALAAGADKPSAQKPASEKVIYSFAGGSDGAYPQSDLILDSAGNLYGTTSQGGVGCNGQGCGTVFELKRSQNGWTKDILYSFAGGSDGEGPRAGLIFDKAGNLFGTTGGTVFKLTPNGHGGWTESVIYAFASNGSAGAGPKNDLVFDSQGNLYGTTSQGGIGGQCGEWGCGSIFQLTPHADSSWTETTIHSFTGGADGGEVSSGVVLDSLGDIYGLTSTGGTGKCEASESIPGCGIVFEFSHDSIGGWTETVIYNFVRGGGYAVNPSSGLILIDADYLLLTSTAGGDGFGAVLELRRSQTKGWEQSILHRFYGNPDGWWPVGKIVDTDDSLFGATSGGGVIRQNGGMVFELKRSAAGDWRERILHDFTGAPDGNYPGAGVVSDSSGHLYGTTQWGGGGFGCTFGCGVAYEIAP
jgi:hypothetical protein